MADILLIVCAVHLTATVMACGAVFFYVLVAAPAVRKVRASPEAFDVMRVSPLWVTLKCTFAVSLCVALISGVTWFLEVATAMGEGETDDAGTLACAVLTGTQFGRCCLLRLAMAAALACCFPMFNPRGSQSGRGWRWGSCAGRWFRRQLGVDRACRCDAGRFRPCSAPVRHAAPGRSQ